MKLIQKNCPKCGAPLSFEENDKITICEYCKNKITITRKSNNSTSADFILSIEEFYKKRYMQTERAKIVAVIIVLIFMAICCFAFVKLQGKEKNDVPEVPITQKQYITEISQLDENLLKNCYSKALEKLNNNIKNTVLNQTEWERVGIYLLDHKETKQLNLFYDVYKKEYQNNNENITVYAAVEVNGLEITNGVINNYHVSSTFCPTMRIDKEVVCGYQSLEEFFNKIIRNKTQDYKVISTDGLYLEKIGN